MLNRNERLRQRRQMQRRIRDVVAERRMALLDGGAAAEEPDDVSGDKSKQDCAA